MGLFLQEKEQVDDNLPSLSSAQWVKHSGTTGVPSPLVIQPQGASLCATTRPDHSATLDLTA